MSETGSIPWQKFPRAAAAPRGRDWLIQFSNWGADSSSVVDYGGDLDDFAAFCARTNKDLLTLVDDDVALWVADMRQRPETRKGRPARIGMANATIVRRVSSVRQYFDYLVEHGERSRNPIPRGQYIHRGRSSAPPQEMRRGPVRRLRQLPFIPNEQQIAAILYAAKDMDIRTRAMLPLQYDCALRRQELSLLQMSDFDFALRTVSIRAEIAKYGSARVLPYSEETGILLGHWLWERRRIVRSTGPMWISLSHRNRGEAISVWTWSKVMEQLAELSKVDKLSTHTWRHLRLTDLARSGWELHEISAFAGHRHLDTTQIYITLSARDLVDAFARSNETVQAWRMEQIARQFTS
jgi:site-specific recombinase XerD